MLRKIKEAWAYLNGKKTVIGATVSVVGELISIFDPSTGIVLLKLGAWISGIGLTHKGQKKYSQRKIVDVNKIIEKGNQENESI